MGDYGGVLFERVRLLGVDGEVAIRIVDMLLREGELRSILDAERKSRAAEKYDIEVMLRSWASKMP